MTASSNLETSSTTCASDANSNQETSSSTSDNLSPVESSQVGIRVNLTTPDRVLHSAGRLCNAASAAITTNNEQKLAESTTKTPSDRNNNTNDTAKLQTVGDIQDVTDHCDLLAKAKSTTAMTMGDATATPPVQLASGDQSRFRRSNNLPTLNCANHQQPQQIPYDQQILSTSLPAATQLQHQQNFVQPTAAGVYHHPLVSWTCPVTTTGGGRALREGPQLYGTPLLYHHPHLTCTAGSYHPHLQHAMMTNFGPAPLSHAPSYLASPAVYTGHHHLYNQHHSNQLLPPPVAPLQVKGDYNFNYDRVSPSSISVSSVESACEMNRVIVDCGDPPESFPATCGNAATSGVVAKETGQRNKSETRAQDAELAAMRRLPEPAPRDENNDQNSSDKHNTATLCDDGRAFARCANRSPSQQQQQSQPTATAPGRNLIRCDDNKIMNDICRTTKHRQQRPLNETRPSVTQCEAQIRGKGKEGDELVERQRRRHTGSGQLLEVAVTATAKASVAARGQTSTSAQTRIGAVTLTDQQQQQDHSISFAPIGESNDQRKQLRPDRESNRRNQDLMVAAGEARKGSLSTNATNSSNTDKGNNCPGDSKGCRRVGEFYAEAPSRKGAGTQLDERKIDREHEDEEPTTKIRTRTKSDGEAAKLIAELNPISINGTTFYHVDPAALLCALPTTTTVECQGGHQFATGYNYNVGATYQPMGGIAPNLIGYYQPHYQLVNDYVNQPPAAGRLADHHFYYWPNSRQPPPPPAGSVPFELVQSAPFGLVSQRLDHPQHYVQLASEMEQRPYLTYHQVAASCARPYDQHFSHLPPAVVSSTQPAFEFQMAPIGAPNPQTATVLTQQSTPTTQPQPPPAVTTTTATTMSNSTGVSQLKLGYNLIPLLPISAIPTRVRQAYGMDKVWQDEFEQLFSQFVSQVVWTLVEVETNPNIRSSSRILAYKSRYIVRVDNGSVTATASDKNSADESASVASTAAQEVASPSDPSEATGDEGEEEDEGDANSSWDGPEEDVQNCCCDSSSVADTEENQQPASGVDGDCGRQGPRSGGSNSGESDCDSGAVLNSTSGSSETTSHDLSSPNELAGPGHQSPASSPPCLDSSSSNQDETNAADSGRSAPDCSMHHGRRFPLKFRMFIDSAKVRFCCDSCGHGWTSMKGRVVFWYELFELVDGPSRNNATSEGVSNLIGYCAYKLFGQQCDICKIENRFERPMWYPEEVTKVLCNLFYKIGQVYFGFRMPSIDKQRRAGKPKTSHNSLLCQACHDGVCTDRK